VSTEGSKGQDRGSLHHRDQSLVQAWLGVDSSVTRLALLCRGDMKKHLMLLSRAADSICDGDLVDNQIRSKQNWSLLPTQVSVVGFVVIVCLSVCLSLSLTHTHTHTHTHTRTHNVYYLYIII
jgi:hypothetical protein